MTTTRPGYTRTLTDGDDYLFEQIDEDGSQRCTACGAVGQVDGQDHPSMYAGGHETSVTCTVCGSTEADADPFKGTRVIYRRDDPRTLADIEHAYDNPEWLGFGYLAGRSRALHSTDPDVPAQPDRVTEADTWLLAEVNRLGFTAGEFFEWLNSRPGRQYADLWFGGTAGTDHPVEAQSRDLVHRV